MHLILNADVYFADATSIGNLPHESLLLGVFAVVLPLALAQVQE